jgi:peptide-methionine (S)-S-oxide reductase
MSQPEIATLGGGCFWCLEAVYLEMAGVLSVAPGYMGGHVANPSYEQVCMGKTGHAEVARVAFDPSVTSFAEVLDVFFEIHDPTTRDRQGNDTGPQYRSVIFFHSPEQEGAARKAILALDRSGHFDAPVVTEIQPAGEFYPAEDYHREYFRRNPGQPYCRFVVAPKVAKFHRKFAAVRKKPGSGV